MQAYVDEVLAGPLCATLRPGLSLTVKDGRGSRRARTDGAHWIAVPRAMRREWVLLHEVAHCLTADKHGPEFCACYLALVRRHLGHAAADALARAFADHRVRVGAEPGAAGPA
jgi:putative metallohydrolase (TIGR04338 family)